MAVSASKPVRVLCLEDNAGLARLLQKRLERQGYLVDWAYDGEKGLAMYGAGSYDIVVVDQVMPVYTGLEVIRILADRGPLPPMIMVTGTGSEQIAVEAMKLGAGDYLVKDVDGGYLDLLPTVIEQVLQQQRLIEEKQRAEESLRQYAAELETRNEELDAFAHTVAHDLKNPLGSIIGFAEALEEWRAEMSDKELGKYLHLIVEGGYKMNSIIDELLLLASVRKKDVELEPLPMAGIVDVALERLSPLIEKYQAEISLPDTWPVAVGYNPWIEEVWVNYLSNAIKYGGRPPRLELGHSISERADRCGRLRITESSPGEQPSAIENPKSQMARFWVRDNGAGLTPEEQARLFTPFTRLGRVRVEGHGLGLSIVQRIMEKLGGQCGVESEVGRGSVFYFTLSHAEVT